MFARAPLLAWLLTAITGVLVGLSAVELRSQAAAPPLPPPAVVAVTIEVVGLPTATPRAPSEPTPTPTPAPCDPTQPGAPRYGCTGNAR
jgi:hypothetical protein